MIYKLSNSQNNSQLVCYKMGGQKQPFFLSNSQQQHKHNRNSLSDFLQTFTDLDIHHWSKSERLKETPPVSFGHPLIP